MTVQVEIKSETAAKLQAIAASLQLSLDGYLERFTELVPLPEMYATNGQAPAPQLTPYVLAAEFIGSVDSSVPDPASPPIHTAFGQHLLEEHQNQSEKSLPHNDQAKPLALETSLAQFELRSGQQVSQYLGQYPFLLPLILEAEARLKSLFNPETKTALEVTADPSDGSTQLYLVIPTKLPAVTAYELFERLEREWWLEASARARFRLNLVPEFN